MKVSKSGIPTLARFPPKKIVVCHFVVARLFQPAVVVAEYESFATVGEIRVYWRADFQSGSRVLKKVS